MRVLNFGSLNKDFVYQVDHFVSEGETLTSSRLDVFPGGKGLNQSIALAKAGLEVSQAGAVGREDSQILVDVLCQAGVDVSLLTKCNGPSGHAIIQITPEGKNCIMLYPGTNRQISQEMISRSLEGFQSGDLLVIQNEINGLADIVREAKAKGLFIAFNPSPLDDYVFDLDLHSVDIFLVNELEAQALLSESLDRYLTNSQDREAGRDVLARLDFSEPQIESLIRALGSCFPEACVVVTLGSRGSGASYRGNYYRQAVIEAEVVDTTAAGDCFTGFFLESFFAKRDVGECLYRASLASSIAVSRPGAAVSIPDAAEVAARICTLAEGGPSPGRAKNL